MQIISLHPDDEHAIEQIARLLIEGFSPLAWTTMESALKEVRASFGTGHISRIALDDQGDTLGWIAGVSQYEGHVWEMHPLVVSRRFRGQGIGRRLVQDFELQVQARGGITVMLGTDDEDQRTTLSGVNLLPDIFEHIARIRNRGRHPYEFYQKLGYVIVGVIPDANGFGKPDILMAKSLIH